MAELIVKDALLEELNDMVYNRQNADELYCEVKNLVHVIPTTTEAEIRAKAIDEFFDELQKYEDDDWLKLKLSSIYEIAEQLKEE